MCKGAHDYTVVVHAPFFQGGRTLSYKYRSWRPCVKHAQRLGIVHRSDKLHLGRWYKIRGRAKLLIRRACPATRVARSTKGSNRRSVG